MSVPSTIVRILLLEDSDLDAELIKEELRRNGVLYEMHRTETREGFEDGLSHFKPTMVFSDFRLPEFDGGSALELTRKRAPHLPFIIISGAVGEEAAVELLRNGATDFVLKDRLLRLVPAMYRALREEQERLELERVQAELYSCNFELEQRVRDRTRELSEKNEVMEEDLRMAHELQIALLPSRFPTLPRGCREAESAVKICSLYRSSHAVGGDCFNVTRLSDTVLSVFICDVMGHGVRAALVTAMLRALEEQLGEKAADPGLLLSEMNRAQCHIFEASETLVFASACSLTVDVGRGTVTFANAGHPSPLLVHRREHRVEPLREPETRGPALGIFPGTKYQNSTQTLQPDDLILLFTDGLFEVENERAELFTEERLRETVEQHAGLPSEPLVRAVLEDVERFTGGSPFEDDVCVVGVEIARVVSSAA
jgi:serine phosphatase RsbU (regulator of sigma subunit)